MHRAHSSDFAALARILAIGGGNLSQASVIAESTRAPESVRTVLKAAVDAGSLTAPAFASALADSDIVGAFVDGLRSRSLLARLLVDGATRVPLRTRVAAVTANASTWITGEGNPIPVGMMSLAGPALEGRRAAGLLVVTSELLRSTSPAGRALLDNALRGAVADAIDASFVGIITDGLTPISATGTTAADALADLRALLDLVNVAAAGSLYWLLSPDTANRAATLATSGGDLVFAGLSPLGGELLNLPAMVSSAVPAGTLVLVDASGIAAEIEAVTVALADQASIQMDTAPSSPLGASTVMRSLWQENKVALLARAFFGAEVIRAGAIAVLEDVQRGDAP
jgi:HK97 family phage major capsid protein